MWIKRTMEMAAMLMIGDGLLAMVEPKRHCMLWKIGPAFCQNLMEDFIEHPGLTRVAGGVELALGLWLASKQTPDEEEAEMPVVRTSRQAPQRRQTASSV